MDATGDDSWGSFGRRYVCWVHELACKCTFNKELHCRPRIMHTDYAVDTLRHESNRQTCHFPELLWKPPAPVFRFKCKSRRVTAVMGAAGSGQPAVGMAAAQIHSNSFSHLQHKSVRARARSRGLTQSTPPKRIICFCCRHCVDKHTGANDMPIAGLRKAQLLTGQSYGNVLHLLAHGLWHLIKTCLPTSMSMPHVCWGQLRSQESFF